MDDLDLILWLFLVVGSAGTLAAFLFYGGAFLVQRIKMLWIEIEIKRAEAAAATVGVQMLHADVQSKLVDVNLKHEIIRPDENGLLPVSRAMIDSGAITEAVVAAMHAYIATLAPVQNVPHTLHWAPHIKGSDALPVAAPEQLTADNWLVPSFQQLIGTDFFQPGRFLLGFSMEDHAPVYGTWKDIYSCAIGGQPGTGKSTATRSLLAQSAMGGCQFVVVDPHFGAGEDSLGESLQPLRRAMLCDVASNDKASIDAVRYIDSIGKGRISGDKDRSPIMLVVDEATALFSRSTIGDELTKLLEAIAQEYRKVGVFALCLGQIWTASRTGGDTGLRDSFASALVCKMKRSQARMLVPTEVAREVEVLNIGQAILWKTSGEFARLAIPNCTQTDIEVIANRVFWAQSNNSAKAFPTPEKQVSKRGSLSPDLRHLEPLWKDSGTPLETTFDAKALRATKMFRNGKTFSEIIVEVWGVTTGRKYQEASHELQNILREELHRGQNKTDNL